jgi:hypothetical protein
MSAGPSKPIRLSRHARGRLLRRGFTEDEVAETIRTGRWLPVSGARWEASKTFAFQALWNGRHYSSKKVRPIFVDLATEIVVVTVYTYYL